MDTDVTVVGAGLSGLSAAYHLLKKDPNLKVILLEAKDRLGGRTLTLDINAANGKDKWDLGGQWIGSTQPHVLDLLAELKINTYKQYTTGYKFQQLGDNQVRKYSSDIPALSWFSLIQLHFFMSKVEYLRKQIKEMDPMTSPKAIELDSVTVEQFVNQHVSSQGAKEAIASAGRCMFGVEPSQMSMLYYLMYCSAAGSIEALISTKEKVGGQEYKIEDGAQQISECLAEKIGNDKVHLNQPVAAIKQLDDHVEVTTVAGKQYICKKAILAIPPHQAGKIEYLPKLPGEKAHVFERMPVGHLIKFIVTYKTCFWRENGASGEICTNGGPSIINGCDTGPLCIVFDATSSKGNPAIVGFIGGDQAIQYMKVSIEDRKRAVLYSLSEFFGQSANDCIEYVEKNWHDEAYNGGCPVSVGTPGIMEFYSSALQDPFQRLHFAGTESATVWCGFLNGAVQAGYRAASEVLYDLCPAAVTRQDLIGTCYDRSRRRMAKRKAGPSNQGLYKCSVSLAVVCVLGYVALRKGYIKIPAISIPKW